MTQHTPSGYIALITMIIVGIVVTTTAVFLLVTGVGASLNSQAAGGSTSARSAAQSCMELALASIQANTNLTTPSTGTYTLNAASAQTCSYAITGSSPTFAITSTGQVGQGRTQVVRKLSTSTYQISPQLGITTIIDIP